MFTLKKSINHIKSFKASNLGFIYLNDEMNLVCNNKIISKNNESYFCSDKLMGYHLDQQTIIINAAGAIVNTIEVFFHPDNLIGNTFTSSKKYFRNSDGMWESDLYLFQFEPCIELKKYKYNIIGGFTRLNSGFLQKRQGGIIFLNGDYPTPLWQFDLQQLGTFSNGSERAFPYEVERFLGVMGESLFVKVSNNQILVLHSQTGELVKRLSSIDERRGESSILFDLSDNFFFRMTYHFVPEKQIIYGLFYDTLYEIQCHDSIYTITHGLKNEFLAKGIQNPHAISSKSVLFENQLYFMEQEQGRFGILDIASREIIFLSDPIDITGKPQSIDKLKEIQVAPNKVYVLTHDHTLHIFEKENGL